MTTALPFISIITCTYNRAMFLQNMKKIVAAQDYPHNKIEWIIMDDSPENCVNLFEPELDGIKVRYIYLKTKVPLAKKRDLLNHVANGVILVNMDDDDYYPACRVSHAVETLLSKKTELAGSSKMYMYFTRDKKIYQFGPYQENHGTAATLAYTKKYAQEHMFYEPINSEGKGHYGEEGVFTENYRNAMAQLDPFKTVLALSHTDNTVDKTFFLEKQNGHMGNTVHETNYKLKDFIKTEEIYKFYDSLGYEYKVNQYTEKIRNKMENKVAMAEMAYRQHMLKRMINDINLFKTNMHKQSKYNREILRKLS